MKFTLTAGLSVCSGSEGSPVATYQSATKQAQEPTTAVPSEPAILTPTVADGGEADGRAYIDSLVVHFLESFPVQVEATVRGNLSDGCTTLEGINSELYEIISNAQADSLENQLDG